MRRYGFWAPKKQCNTNFFSLHLIVMTTFMHMLVFCVLCANIVVQFIYATEALFQWWGKVYITHMVPSLKAFSDIESKRRPLARRRSLVGLHLCITVMQSELKLALPSVPEWFLLLQGQCRTGWHGMCRRSHDLLLHMPCQPVRHWHLAVALMHRGHKRKTSDLCHNGP